MGQLEFATLDFETTGLNSRRDRVIEVGVVRTAFDGSVVAEFTSLINPSRDLGRTDIHGISAGMLSNAPEFEEIAPGLVDVLNGAILVGHNAKFDTRFLASELLRLDYQFKPFDPLCTLELMYLGFPRGPRRLSDCCQSLGIEMGQAHAALDDARMTARLLHVLLHQSTIPFVPDAVSILTKPSSGYRILPRTGASSPRQSERDYLSECVGRMAATGDVGLTSAVVASQYLNLLDKVLEDRRLTHEEAETLVEFADELGIGRDVLHTLHSSYVARLCEIVKRDGQVTELERRDVEIVAGLLNVSSWQEVLDGDSYANVTGGVKKSGLLPGMSVCFTGEMSMSRSDITRIAEGADLIVKTSVSRTLDLLVIADSDSMSTKAKKARELGIRIVSEAVFVQLLSELD